MEAELEQPVERELISVVFYAIHAAVDGIVTMKAEDLSLRFGRDLPTFEVVRWDEAHETYVFVVHKHVNVELICSDLGFRCRCLVEGVLPRGEYNSNYRVCYAHVCESPAEARVERRMSKVSLSSSAGRLFHLEPKVLREV